ncbi:ethanolamine kinase 1 [Macrosteles quadrilineatus]|uniref:ethanolamine kinase 1 n=1 Tax=Macrosteles quadrilineatus TaxID=74068 RepID=UPI0023E0F7CE|nr:ethanolamine kinase 1 [Macrosteles quadrilineatus]
MEQTTSPPHLDITVLAEELEAGAATVLEAIRPAWSVDKVTYKLFTDGITNKLIGCFNSANGSSDVDIILVRVYGPNTDLLINRKTELENIKLLQGVGFAPPLFATFNNGLAYQYIPGEVLTVETVRSPEIYPHVARRLAQLHRLRLHDCQHEPMLWPALDKFIKLIPQQYSDPDKQKRFASLVAGGVQSLAEECESLRSALSHLHSPVVFCHNDLLLGNIIRTPSSVSFIDYEYAAYNYQAFDIGNHFDEFAGVSDVDFSRYPEPQLQQAWLQVYLEEFLGRFPNDSEVTTLYEQVNKFALAAHFIWGIWALVQAQHSNIDFDFVQYAALRLGEYFKNKSLLLSEHESS